MRRWCGNRLPSPARYPLVSKSRKPRTIDLARLLVPPDRFVLDLDAEVLVCRVTANAYVQTLLRGIQGIFKQVTKYVLEDAARSRGISSWSFGTASVAEVVQNGLAPVQSMCQRTPGASPNGAYGLANQMEVDWPA